MSEGAKLLVVDDDDMMLDFSEMVLTSLGYRCVTATNGAAALQMLEQDGEIRLLIADMRLGDVMNGRELALRASEIRPDLRILLTSGDPAALQGGGLDHLAKPFRRKELAAKVESLLSTP